MSDFTIALTGETRDNYIEQRFNKENKELVERISEHQKENERQFKEAKKLIGFSLRGKNKYYYANQCAIFSRNFLPKRDFTKWEQITFHKYSINYGYSPYGRDVKRFNNKEEMLGFVIGYNNAKGWS